MNSSLGEIEMQGAKFAVTFLSVLLSASGAIAQSTPASFYKGKQFILKTGSDPGDGYDLYGRLLSRHLSKYIPGSPPIIVQYVPGGGSLILANQFGNITPRDGSVFGLFNSGMPTAPLLNPSATQFDPRKFSFIGSPNREAHALIVWHEGPVKKYNDLFEVELIAGASAPGAAPFEFPRVTNALLGTKFKIVTGYTGSGAILLAMQRGEIHAYPGVAWVSARKMFSSMIKDKQMNVIAQYGFNRHPDLADVPLFPTGESEDEKRLYELLYARQSFGRPFVFPQDVPADRVAAIRTAFGETMKDRDFLADATKIDADINPVSGEELDALTKRLFKTPAAIVTRLQSLIAPHPTQRGQ
jgi:tripartite-type tricarboxylate transporter receptor subunit TctC